MPIPLETYLDNDVVTLARSLLGKTLFTHIDGDLTGGIITETEAYRAPEDKASHAYGNRRTPRTEVMFGPGGRAYVYLCYGVHHLFNIVTNVEGVPHAILIRAIEPTHGLDQMRARRSGKLTTTGPGTLSQALGITTALSGTPLDSKMIYIADLGHAPETITTSPRVGIGYAGEWVDRPWRFQVKLPINSPTLDTVSQ
jgi:DNA-3-methyladenine glycosylase